MPLSSLTLSALLAVCVYYVVVWILVGRDPKPGIFVAQYDPPVGLSPAMVRFLWKERFDDRVFWSGVLSLVAKGAASLNSSGQFTMVSPTGVDSITCSPEERPLLSWIKHRKKHATVSLLDPDTSYAASQMAVALRQAAVGKWLLNNRQYVLSGVVASAVAICIVASPRTTEQWEALLLGPGVAAPGVFYLAFVLMRLTDLLRAARVHISRPVLKRAILLGFMMFPCAAAIALGSVVMGSVLGVRTLFATAFLVLINLLFLHWMKAPTAAGRELLDKIEGFRHFLRSVDKFPMDRVDAPSDHPGLYERYLPYAVALEVEQDWSDRFIFLTETFHAPSELAGYHSFYLGMWNDKPVEIVLGPPKK